MQTAVVLSLSVVSGAGDEARRLAVSGEVRPHGGSAAARARRAPSGANRLSVYRLQPNSYRSQGGDGIGNGSTVHGSAFDIRRENG
eukprot:3035379-Prymnesium_polylepis.1